MPEELRDLMGRAVRGARAARRRRRGLESGAAASAGSAGSPRSHRSSPSSAWWSAWWWSATGDDEAAPVFADLTAEDQAVVDEYLGVLEDRGVLGEFPDERAAVEYAWRVECFGPTRRRRAVRAERSGERGGVSAHDGDGGVGRAGQLDAAFRTRSWRRPGRPPTRRWRCTEDAVAHAPDRTGMDVEEAEVLDVALTRPGGATDRAGRPSTITCTRRSMAAAEGLLVTAEDFLQVDQTVVDAGRRRRVPAAGRHPGLLLAPVGRYHASAVALARACSSPPGTRGSPATSSRRTWRRRTSSCQSFIEWALTRAEEPPAERGWAAAAGLRRAASPTRSTGGRMAS